MFEVFVTKKKAVPGLAKFLLFCILLVAFGFAWFVQHKKLSVGKLDLDKKVSVSLSVGDISFRISSDWKELDKGSLSQKLIRGWQVASGGEGDIRFYVGELGRSDIVGQLRVFSAVRSLFPSGDVFVEPEYVENGDLPSCVGSGAVIVGSKLVPFYVRVIFLPGGNCFLTVFVGGNVRWNAFDVWDNQIGETIKFRAKESVVSFRAKGGKISVGCLAFKSVFDSWVIKDPNFDVIRIGPVVSDSSKLWVGSIKAMSLSDYREPAELLTDHFVTFESLDRDVDIERVGGTKGVELYRGRDSDVIRVAKRRYEYVEMCWVVRVAGGESVLACVHCEVGCEDIARAQMESLLRSVKVISVREDSKGADGRKARDIDTVGIFKRYNIAAGVSKLAGWYLASLEDESIGFDALMFSAVTNNNHLRVGGFDYGYYDSGVIRYTQREYWELFSQNMTGRYSSRIELEKFSSVTGKKRHLIFIDNEFSANNVRVVVRIDDRIKENEFARRKEFLPDGGELLLAGMMASKYWRFGDIVRCCQLNNLNAHLQSVVFKRVVNKDGIDVLVMNDDELVYGRYKFDKSGRWVGIDGVSGFKLRRVDERKVASLYRRRSGRAVRFFEELEKEFLGDR